MATESTSNTSLPHQELLRNLVRTEIGLLILIIIASICFPVPTEIESAMTVMDELDLPESSDSFLLFATISAGLFGFLLYMRSLWQLFHLNKSGVNNFIISVSILIAMNFFIGGSWASSTELALTDISSMVTGAIIILCTQCDGVFANLTEAQKNKNPQDESNPPNP